MFLPAKNFWKSLQWLGGCIWFPLANLNVFSEILKACSTYNKNKVHNSIQTHEKKHCTAIWPRFIDLAYIVECFSFQHFMSVYTRDTLSNINIFFFAAATSLYLIHSEQPLTVLLGLHFKMCFMLLFCYLHLSTAYGVKGGLIWFFFSKTSIIAIRWIMTLRRLYLI